MISLCLTNYNRDELLFKSFENVIDNPKISEVVIVDDCSEHHIYDSVKQKATHSKIRLFRNYTNIGMSRNKLQSLIHAKNETCILFDSDNVLTNEYIDAIPKTDADVIYMPSFAKPNFDFRQFANELIDKHNLKSFLDKPNFEVILNTCNYVVNRSNYLSVYQYNPVIKGCDTLWFNYLWLKSGFKFFIIYGMQYSHLVHDGSTWLKDSNYNLASARCIIDEMKKW